MSDQPKILFVDDEDSIRLTFTPLLQSYGFAVTSAATVAEALDVMTKNKFDVLISDLNIGHPGDGFTVVSAMRKHQPDALRFILTGYPAFESALEAIREEVHDYLIKPTETEILVEKIRSKLAQRSPDQSILRRRLPEVIRASKKSIVEHWSERVKQDSEISSVPISDSERREYLPLLLDVATGVAEGKELTPSTGWLTCNMEPTAKNKATAFHCSSAKRDYCRLRSQIASNAILKGSK
jgi:YesN/AraC family two-component response regulator